MIPEINSVWINKNHGTEYRVYDITNLDASPGRVEEYPIRVSYERLSDGTRWTRPLSDWYRSYRLKPKTVSKAYLCWLYAQAAINDSFFTDARLLRRCKHCGCVELSHYDHAYGWDIDDVPCDHFELEDKK
jgi:hypothetical protein